MYVDDLDSEVICAKTVCINPLGPTAIAEDKTETGTRLDVLGYVLDLKLKLVSISRQNFLDAVYGFFTTNLNDKISIQTAEKLAS